MIEALIRLTTGRARLVLAVTALFFVVASVVGGGVAKVLSEGDDFRAPNAEFAQAEKRLAAASGAQAAPGVIVLVETPQGARTPSARQQVRRLTRDISRDREVASVASYVSTGSDRFVARDGKSTYLAVFVTDGADDWIVGGRLAEQLADQRNVKVGGPGLAFEALSVQIEEDLKRAELVAFPIIFLLSLWVFRGLVAALMPIFVGALTVTGTFFALRVFNEAVLLSIFALNLAVGLGLGLAIDYSLFIVSRFREELARGLETRAALAKTMRTAGRTVLFSAATVAVALLSLLAFPQRFLYSIGIGGALTALLAAAVALTALPALLMVLGPRINSLAPARWQRSVVATEQGFWYRLSRGVMRRSLPVAIVTATILIVAGLPFLRIEFTGIDARMVPNDEPVKQIDIELRENYARGVIEPITIAVSAPRDAGPQMRRYARQIQRLDGVAQLDPPQYLGKNVWQVNIVADQPALEDRTQQLVRDIRATRAPGDALVAGQTARFLDQQEAVGARLPFALLILASTTFVILFLMTGSVVLPIKALIMNLLGISATFGLLVLIFQDGRFESLLDYESLGALENTQPLLLLALAFGLSTDYAVFLLTRIKEARDSGLPNREAVAVGLERTGRIITAAALLFCVAIGAFATSKIGFIKEVGLGTALAVAIDATIVRALLVPALMELLGDWNWWAPRPLRRVYDRFGLREGGDEPPASGEGDTAPRGPERAAVAGAVSSGSVAPPVPGANDGGRIDDATPTPTPAHPGEAPEPAEREAAGGGVIAAEAGGVEVAAEAGGGSGLTRADAARAPVAPPGGAARRDGLPSRTEDRVIRLERALIRATEHLDDGNPARAATALDAVQANLRAALRAARGAALQDPVAGAHAAAHASAAQHATVVGATRMLDGAPPGIAVELGRALHLALDGRDELGGAVLVRPEGGQPYVPVLQALAHDVEIELEEIAETLRDGELAGSARTSLSAARRRIEQVRAGLTFLLRIDSSATDDGSPAPRFPAG